MSGKIPVLSIIVVFMMLTLTISAAELPFGGRLTIDTSYSGAASLTTGDIDGDGLEDIVAAGLTHSSLSWWRSLGDGTFTRYDVVASASSVDDVELADIDRDGDLDVLVTATVPINAVGWYENTGSPMAGAWPLNLIAINFGGASGTATGDFDGNGTLDVVGVALNADLVTVALNNTGAGIGWSYETVDNAFDGARWVSAGDINGDGITDIAAVAYVSGEVSWWNRDAGVWNQHAIATGDDAVADADVLELADMDKDGDLDALGASQTGAIRWWENDGSGGSWTEHTVGDPTGNVSAAYAKDLDLDGDPDVIYSAYGTDGVGWYENTAGDGLSWQKRVVDAALIHAFDVTATDFDGDGDPDLAAVDFDDDTVAAWENLVIHRNATFPEVAVVNNTSDRVTDLYPVDLDQDGDSDILVAEQTGSEVAWLENTNGDSSAWTPHSIWTGLPAKAVTAGDVNCDGSTDVVMVTQGDATTDPVVLWLEDDGIGGWTEHTIVDPSPHYDDDAMGLADLDGDGDLDLVLASASDGLEWYENDACGAWIEHYLGGGYIWDADSMALADMDGDGDTDVVVASFDEVKWIPNELNISGFFGAEVDVAVGLTNARSVAVGDIDGDGDLDIAALEEGTDSVWWWPNLSGDGATWDVPYPIATAYSDPRIIRLADFDLDGDLDLALAAEDRGTSESWVGWVENSYGAGTMWHARPATMEMVLARTLSVADFDGDGDPDFAYDRMPNETIELFLNRGGQVALNAVSTAPPALDPLVLDDVLEFGVLHKGSVGDADAELASLDLLLTDNLGATLTTADADAVLHGVYVFEDDDDSGDFDPAFDSQVAGIETFALVDGVQHIEFADGDGHVQIPFTSPRYFFVAIAFTSDAASHASGGIEVILAGSAAVAEDADHDLPLTWEWRSDVESGTVVPTDLSLLFEDDFESADTSAWDIVVP